MFRRRGSCGEAGVTLVEVLVTVVILGMAFAAIVGAMGTSILASDIHRKQATSEVVLRDYAETLAAASYVTCGTTSSYEAVSFTPPTGFTVSVTAVEYYTSATQTFESSYGTCPVSDSGLQRLSLRVVSDDARATETLQIVKRSV
ncbi:MAG: prepilin-type N-terminal cleavage/methylation domain-containing protein [Actinomycetota bacterium]